MDSIQFEKLPFPVKAVAGQAMHILDGWWDDEVGLLRETTDGISLPLDSAPHPIRESAIYALGLLMRDGQEDFDRAEKIINLVLDYQFDEPSQPYHGTFYLHLETPHPPANALIWRDYDPNWREFIGTIWAVILSQYAPGLKPELVSRIDTSLQLLVAGTLKRDLPASYSNIALMKAYMLIFAADRFNQPELKLAGEKLAEEIYALYSETGCFEEYNSPTYYGVDLFALGMWVVYSSSARLRELGRRMEESLWLEIGRMYHAGLKNMSGPFDRSYGMDMTKYVTPLGVALRMFLDRESAPLPDIDVESAVFDGDHKDDLIGAIWTASVGLRIPEEARTYLSWFGGERSINRVISKSPRRVATAWLTDNVMSGAEATGWTKPVSSQYHPATIHWKGRGNEINWLKLVSSLPLEATVDRQNLTIQSKVWDGPGGENRDVIFRIYLSTGEQDRVIERDFWGFPGLNVRLETNASGPRIKNNGVYTDIIYSGDHLDSGAEISFNLEIQPVSEESGISDYK